VRFVILFVALTAGCLLPSGVSAQHTVFTSYGPTQISCGSYTAASGNQRNTYDWWVLGFVSGANFERLSTNKPDLASTDSRGLEGWVTKYCADHPLDDVVTAAVVLVRELTARAGAK